MSAPDFSMRESHASKRRVPAATIAAALRLRILSLPIGDGKNLAEARLAGNDGRLRGWACRTRIGESVRELSDWKYVTTSPGVGAGPRRRRFAVAGGPPTGIGAFD
jgi:hypothetical protein